MRKSNLSNFSLHLTTVAPAMDLQILGKLLMDLPLSIFIRESSWAFPTIESIHVVALLAVVGTITIVDLRLVGVASTDCAVTEISRDTLKWTWMAFGLAAVTGSLLLMSKASSYFAVPSLWLKFTFMSAAAVNMLVFNRMTFRTVQHWNVDCAALPRGAKIAGWLSLSFWILVVICGRWIGYTLDHGSIFGHGF